MDYAGVKCNGSVTKPSFFVMACVLYGIQSKRTSHQNSLLSKRTSHQNTPLWKVKMYPCQEVKRTPVISQNIVYKLYNINIYALILL